MRKKILVKVIEYPNITRSEIIFSQPCAVHGKIGKMRNRECVRIYYDQFKGICDIRRLPNNIPVTVITSNGEFTVHHVNTKANCCFPLPISCVATSNGNLFAHGQKIKLKVIGIVVNPNNIKINPLF